MFTGIIQTLGTVRSLSQQRLWVDCAALAGEPLGNSIAVDGCCLTVADQDADGIAFDLLPNTLRLTRIGALTTGDVVNLEPALRVGDRMGGHWVQGHVDGMATVVRVREGEGARLLRLELPSELARSCVERGSLAVNGVSLTVMAIDGDRIDLELIPETCARTNLGTLAEGASVNVETDILARYAARLLAPYAPQ